LVVKRFWQTRAWTDEEIITYQDVGEKEDIDPKKGIPIKERISHSWKQCPAIWYQNTRNTATPDGDSDLESTWPLLDRVDQLNSQAAKAAIANTDPTLILKDQDKAIKRRDAIRKGSGNVITVSPDGDAKYLETLGTSVEMGFAAVKTITEQVLQTTRCVVATPEIIKSNESGEARQILWRSMESKANRLRVALSNAVVELAVLWRDIGRAEKLDLPEHEIKDDKGESSWKKPKAPEEDFEFSVEYPSYWQPTATQVESYLRAFNIAAGGLQVFSIETAARLIAKYLGTDPDVEIQRLEIEKQEAQEQAIEQIQAKGDVNLPNGPKPDQSGEPSAENKPASARPKKGTAAPAKKD
jgi:hypothetical protein